MSAPPGQHGPVNLGPQRYPTPAHHPGPPHQPGPYGPPQPTTQPPHAQSQSGQNQPDPGQRPPGQDQSGRATQPLRQPTGPPPGGRGRRRRSGRGGRTSLIVLLIVALLALAAGAAVAVVLFIDAGRDGAGPSTPPTTASSSAGVRLSLRDDGTSVTLSWTDPSNGAVAFVVAWGQADRSADRTVRVPSGQTSVTINGLNPAIDYCFTVAGIESTTTLALSALVCTQRASASARPSGSPSASG